MAKKQSTLENMVVKINKGEFEMNLSFYKNKKVLVTGHTGFKGTWLCKILVLAGAEVSGYSLSPKRRPNIYELSNINSEINSFIGDIRDLDKLQEVFDTVQPEIVFHLAAQPIVRDSYKNPVYTYETNVMGTVNVLECIRNCSSVKSFLNVTTDKVYKNKEWQWGYRENEELDGFDPYSNSKSCSELITNTYKRSFFKDKKVAISTARAGNVIGGGDFSVDRIIPDCLRAVENKECIIVRNPHSTRPYQHVLEPLSAYLLIAMKQYKDIKFEGSYNVGPDDVDCITTGELVDIFCEKWDYECGWEDKSDKNSPHEAKFLKLDCSTIKSVLGWKPIWHVDYAIEKVIEWSKIYLNYFNEDEIPKIMNKQIDEFFG